MYAQKIAIIGMSCRFPGSVFSASEFWDLLRKERDAVTEIPADRFGTDFYWHPDKREPGKSYTFAAGVLDDIAGFDAAFFGISPREAAQMDPQQRLMLELAWEAFEDAGLRPADLRKRRCGVYVGVESPDYSCRHTDDLPVSDPYSSTGTALSIASNRVSYLFDLHGPSMSINTACSSSLVALHQAVQALQTDEADCALAGGVNLLMHPLGFLGFAKASMLSPRGRCRAFDATGDGYVRSEGGAFVLLKPLDKALADGDVIHAVIAGSGVNSDGYTQGGISVPGAATQAALLRQVYERAGVDVRTLSYLEAHGTGTAVGDPIETNALGEVAAAGRDENDPLLIGSVKTNVGHLETASGMAGLFKAILSIEHRAVPRSLHFETPNPRIDFKGLRLRVADHYQPLESRGPNGITVGVNSFGFGGTNAHIVLTEAPASAATAVARAAKPAEVAASVQATDSADATLPAATSARPAPLVLSARAPQALAALARRYLALLDAGYDWQALAAQTARRRQWLERRAIIAPANVAEGRAALTALAHGETPPDCVAQGQTVDAQARVALVFSGNGSQWPGMGRQLYEDDAVFRAALDEVDALWCADGSASLVEVMRAGATAEWLADTENAQPLLLAIQVGITRVLQARGIRFDATVGHSVGEIAAAWADGALTLADAVRVIKARSRAQALTRGSGRMAAAGVGEDDARALIERLGLAGKVEVAGMNSPQSVTLAGSLQALEQIEAAARASGQFFQMLDLDYAFHSAHMDRIEPVIREQLADLKPRDGNGGYLSTVTGDRLPGSALDAQYWWRNIREPVRFGAAIARLADEGVRLFIEVGPHAILRTYVKQTLAAGDHHGMPLATLKRGHDSGAELTHELLSAIAQGAAVDLDTFVPQPDDAAHDARIPLPTYPWQHERYWLSVTPEGYNLASRKREHPLLGYRLHDAAWAWENQIDPARMPMLADHVVDGAVTFPAAGYLEMALAAARAFFGTSSAAVENLEIIAPVVFQAQQSKQFRLTIEAATARFRIETRDRMSDGPWTHNVSGRLLASGCVLGADGADRQHPHEPDASVAPDLLARLRKQPEMTGERLYEMATDVGLAYGPAFRWVRSLHIGSGADSNMALADLAAPEGLSAAESGQSLAWMLHPALVDSGFHPMFAMLDHAAYLPMQVGRADCLRGDTVRRVLVRLDRRSPHSVLATFFFLDDQDAVVARLSSCRARRIDLGARRGDAPGRFAYTLEARPLPGDFDARALPAPADLIEQATARLAQDQQVRDGEVDEADQKDAQRTHHLTETLPLLDVLASIYALRALDALDAFGRPMSATDAFGPRAALVFRLAGMLVEDGLARREGDSLVRDDEACAQLPELGEFWRGLLADAPDHVAELTLLATSGSALPRVLGAADAASADAPHGAAQASAASGPAGKAAAGGGTRASLIEHFFEASPTWSHAHQMMRACVEQALAAWRLGQAADEAGHPRRRLRVLEIGAAGSDVLRPLPMRLSEAECDYVLAGTAQQLAGFDEHEHPGVRTLVWPSEHGAAASADSAPYDLILIRRALTTRHDPQGVLDEAAAHLAPGGLLLVAEPRRSRFSDIVFGLHDDEQAGFPWNASGDEAAAQTPAGIATLLERAGLEHIAQHDENGLELDGTPTFVAARKPLADAVPQTDASASSDADADTGAASVRPAVDQWLVLRTDAADLPVCATLAEALAQASNAQVDVCPLDDAVGRIASLPDEQVCELVFVAPMAPADADGAAMMRAQQGGAVALARLVRMLGSVGRAQPVRLSIVTRGSAPFAAGAATGTAPLSPDQASLWGLGRTMANEYPEWPLRLIDVHPDVASGAADAALSRQSLPGVSRLVAELLRGDEEEVLLAGYARWVPRMTPVTDAPVAAQAPISAGAAEASDAPAPSSAMLAFESPGSLRNLEWFALPDRALEPDEVEIEPVATGLNFRDVMYAMGLLSDEAVENGFAGASVGMELSGRVVRVGDAVRGFSLGDAVLGFAPASFATRVRTRMGALAHKPVTLPFEAAATIPTTFFTAYYALVELARLRRGERVLVHGGAGGVGIAAIQIARHLGAEVFATAGSREKREFVALLGADHVLDSRSLAFADDIRALTNGQGIDIVLNSLAGEAMVRSIDTLRPFGRFLELGKRDFYENSQIGLRPFRNNISYFGIDADQLMGVSPDLTARLFGEVMQLFGQGVLHPLPYRAFAATQVEDAFRYMQQARQIGKVLVTYPLGTPAPTRGLPPLPLPAFDPAGAYLVVGGTGGFGFATARWLVARGARHVTLISRGGKLNPAQAEEVARWRQETGAQVQAVACDVTDVRALTTLVAAIEACGTPVKGVVHSAMQIDDGLLRNLDDARFAAVLAPKVAGAWNLHRVLGDRALDCFIVYSSATTYLGNPGQSSYVAANSFLEALVAMRRAAGQKATFMAWGPIQDVGFLARNEQTRDALQSRIGGSSITSEEALAALDAALATGAPGQAVVRLDWGTVARGMPAAHARRYVRMHKRGADDGAREGGSQLRKQLLTLPADEAQTRVADVLQAQIARILHLSPDRIERDKSVLEMGMDSLMGMELGMAVEEQFQVKLSVMAIADGATVQSLAARVYASVLAAETGGAAVANQATSDAVADVTARYLSAEERALLDAGEPDAEQNPSLGQQQSDGALAEA